MQVEIPYGETTVTATLPAGTRRLSNAERAALPPAEDLEAAVRTALAAPRGLPRIRELVEDSLDGHPADRPERSRRVIVERDGHRRARTGEGTDARQSARGRERRAHGAVQIGQRGQARVLVIGEEPSVIGQLGPDRRLTVWELDLHGPSLP